MALNSNNLLSSLTGARQTMLSWAKVIDTYAALPEVFKAACKPVLSESSPFPYVVLAPATLAVRHRPTEKLLCEADGVFYVWENVGGRVVRSAFPLKTICALEVGGILLNSWLTVSGLTLEGEQAVCVIPFNTATGRHLAPFISKMRPAFNSMDEADWRAEQDKFDQLSGVSFKFMNFARESLARGEKVIDFVWQPAIREAIFTLFGRSIYRNRVLAHLAVLTDKELILIRDDEHSVENRGVRYGGIWQYIPLRHISAAGLGEPGADTLTLSLTLARGGQNLELVFAASSRQALEQFRDALSGLIG